VFKGCGTTCDSATCDEPPECPPGQVLCGNVCCPEGQSCVDGQCVVSPCAGTCCVNGQAVAAESQEACESCETGLCGTWFNSCEPCVCEPPTPFDDCPIQPGTCNRQYCAWIANSSCIVRPNGSVDCSQNNAQGATAIAQRDCPEVLNLPGSCFNGGVPSPDGEIQYSEPYPSGFGFWSVDCWRCSPENPLP
jgi:hypothetical protein